MKNWTECSLAQHRFPIRFVSFFVRSVCLLVRVTMVYHNKAVVCCLLATSVIMLSEKKNRKRKMWSKKWYLKRNISCDAHLLHELLETDVPWDYAIVVSAGKLRKLWDSLSELYSSLCERRLERTVVRSALFPVKTAQFTHEKTVGFTEWTVQLSVWKTTGKDSCEVCVISCKNCEVYSWGNCGIPWVNCAVLCVKDDWKGQLRGLRNFLSKLRSLLMRKLWDSLSELCSSLCERRLERTVVRSALFPVKTAHFTQFFRHIWRHTVKSLSLTDSV